MCTIGHEFLFNSVITFLPPKTVLSCRLVCSTWQKRVDKVICNLDLWREYCQKDYSEICLPALIKSQLGWYHLYKTLTLWPKVSYAQETKAEFAVADYFHEEILGIQVLRDGIIGVHTRKKIQYYNVHTLKLAHRNEFIGSYSKYRENGHIISVLNYKKGLSVIFKSSCYSAHSAYMFKLNSVKVFLAIEKTLYYVSDDNTLYTFEIIDSKFTCTNLSYIPDGVLSLGQRNGYLHILTQHLKVLKLEGTELKYVQTEKEIALLYELRKYNFLEELNLQIYYYWLAVLMKFTPNISVNEIITIHSYGNVLFVGYKWGVLNIYISPYHENIIEVLSRKPTKVLHLRDSQKLSLCPILNIDIVEDIDSHKVVIAMPQKVVVMNLNYDFWGFGNVSQYCDEIVRHRYI